MKKIYAVIFFSLFTSFAWADVDIPEKYFVGNQSPGRCAWASIESLSLASGYAQVRGLTDHNNRVGERSLVYGELHKLGIPFSTYQATDTEWWYYCMGETNQQIRFLRCFQNRQQATDYIKEINNVGTYWVEPHYSYKIKYLQDAINKGLGAAISLDISDHDQGRHMVVIVGLDEFEVRLIDSNYNRGEIRHMRIDEFLAKWNGYALVIRGK